MKTRAIATVLILRGVVHAAVAAQLLWVGRREWVDVLPMLSPYALTDGVLALFVVGLLLHGDHRTRGETMLLLATTADALVRLAAGAVIMLLPGIPYFAVTTALFLGALGALAATLGGWAFAMAMTDVRARRRHMETGLTISSEVALGTLGTVAVGAGVLLLENPVLAREQAHVVGALAAIAFSVAFAVAAAGEWQGRRRDAVLHRAALS